MNIVIPIAGAGLRFSQAGFQAPKMLIEAAKRPLLYWALDSLKPYVSLDDAIFVCLKEHIEQHPLERVIRTYCPNARIIALDHITAGQAQTVLAARSLMHAEEPLLIYNCDTYMNIGRDLFRSIKAIDGIIPVFQSQDPCFSYALTDDNGRVLQVAEKTVVSNHATTGLYHFSASRDFCEAAEEAFDKQQIINGEYYVAPLYNLLIQKGYKIHIAHVETCVPLGTPAQLQAFESSIAATGLKSYGT